MITTPLTTASPTTAFGADGLIPAARRRNFTGAWTRRPYITPGPEAETTPAPVTPACVDKMVDVLLPLLHAVYLIVCNLILFNLLIAMFKCALLI